MPLPFTLLLGLGLFVVPPGDRLEGKLDLAQLQEVLHDRQDARGQSQAALLLLQSSDPAAESIIRQGLRQVENEDVFVALSTALRLRPDERFLKELLAAFAAAKPRVRQAAAETVAALPIPSLVQRLQLLAEDAAVEMRVRQMALWTLGRCGRKEAAAVLVHAVSAENEDLRRIAAVALQDLTGQNHGMDVARWKAWLASHKDLTQEQWLTMRLGYQTTRAQRLEGELLRARAQVLRLQQQLYTRLPTAERFTHLQSVLEQDDPGVRALAVAWASELMSTADASRQSLLTQMLLRLTNDGNAEVQRAAVVALGKIPSPQASERLQELLKGNSPAVRAAAVRALSLQARGATTEARARLKEVVPLLQQALEDKALEVVVEAAEALGMLGAPEAGPVLIGLLRHPSEHVRQTAAQALERTADAGLLEGLLRGLDDSSVAVRFGLLGAITRAAGSSQVLPSGIRKRLLDRLESLLKRDPDAGVRSRAATVMGECGTTETLTILWQQVQTCAEGRVQEKAWDAFVEILTRAGSPSLLEIWDKKLAESSQDSRRVQMWSRVYSRWEQVVTQREQATAALEGLARTQREVGKWSAAAPLYQTLLARTTDSSDALRLRCLEKLAQIAEEALKEGNLAEASRLLREARPYLPKSNEKLLETFDRLEKDARGKE